MKRNSSAFGQERTLGELFGAEPRMFLVRSIITPQLKHDRCKDMRIGFRANIWGWFCERRIRAWNDY